MSWYPYPSTHNARNLRKWWAKGKPCPVAFWIGHHPAVSIGAQAKLAYGESHWGAAGALAGSALRLVPSLTHGDALMVPADAEVVIEGFAPPGVLEADGPFGEYAGYMGAQTLAPVCEVTAITRRSDAIWHDYASGLADMLVPADQVRSEAVKLATEIATSAPIAVVSTRATLRRGLVDEIRNAVAHESVEQNAHYKTADFKEGVAAMAARRTPQFIGR
jgi:UbiD family decarboxylase